MHKKSFAAAISHLSSHLALYLLKFHSELETDCYLDEPNRNDELWIT